jgi:hypothetical protein
VPVQVAHDRVVALGHVDREHLRGAGLHRRIAGLPHVGEALGVLVEPVRFPFEPVYGGQLEGGLPKFTKDDP